MATEYFTEFGPGFGQPSLNEFICQTVARAVGLGCQVRGPYKVRHHRGDWITVFEFTSSRKRDIQCLLAYAHNTTTEAVSHWPQKRTR